MFAKLVKTSVPSNFLILPVVFITGWWSLFIGRVPAFVNSKSIFLDIFPDVFSSSVWSVVISLVFIILTTILLIPFSTRYLHGVLGNSVPAYIFITITSIFCWTFYNGPALIAMFFGMLVYRDVFETYHLNRVFHLGFMAGFYSAIASLVYMPSIVFLAISWIGFILLRSLKLREFFIILTGFIVPLLFTHAWFMINDKEQLLYQMIISSFVRNKSEFHDIWQIIFISVIGLFVLWAVLKTISSGSLKKVVLRRYFEIFVISMLFLVLVFIFLFSDFSMLEFLFLPLSFIMAIVITSIRKQIWVSLFLFLLIVTQIFVQLKFLL